MSSHVHLGHMTYIFYASTDEIIVFCRFQDKLTELLTLFTAQQSKKLTEDEIFFSDFVQALYAYTFTSE